MKKLFTLAIATLSLFFLAACDSMDSPSPLDTRATNASGTLNPDNLPEDASMGADSGLADRGEFGNSGMDYENINPEDNFFDDLYQAYSIHRVAATRMINSNANKRGKINELLICN